MKSRISTTKFVGMTIALVLMTSAYGVDTLYDKRFQHWTQEAEQGNADSQYNLGNAYLRGNEVPVDLKKAVTWLQKAAEQDHAKAEYKLGYLYYVGQGVPQDYGKAYQWLKKAAAKDYSPAQFYFGKLYAEGNGVRRDYEKALYWYTQAAADNFSLAKKEIESVKAAHAKEAEEARAAAQARAARSARIEQAKNNRPIPQETKPAVATEQEFDTRKLLIDGGWLNQGGLSAKHMPSKISTCKESKAGIACTTKTLQRSNVFADITYIVEAKFGKFSPNGKFFGSYRSKVLSVRASVDDENPSEEDIPRPGWQQKTVVRCKFTDKDVIECVNDNFQKEKFTR